MRSEHLGLSSLDIETAGRKDGATGARGAGNIPRSLLLKQKETVANVLGKTGGRNQFRLDMVTSDFFGPLCDMVKKNGAHSWVLGTDRACSLDCLLLGYLALMSPPLKPPHHWLQDALSAKYPPLLEWATNFRQESFRVAISAADAEFVPPPGSPQMLPWHPQPPISITDVGLCFLLATFGNLPVISAYRDSSRIIRAFPAATKSALYGPLRFAGSVLGVSIGYYFYTCLRGGTQQGHAVSRKRNTTNQRDFGEAGRMLGLGGI